ncbi:MAG: SH3 domain-containing protein [Bacteroidota bacterium]
MKLSHSFFQQVCFIFCCLWGFHLPLLKAQYVLPKNPGVYYVTAPSGLNMREAPTPTAVKIMKIPYGEQVELLKEEEYAPVKMGWMQGNWAKIKVGDNEGFAFGAYLIPVKPPARTELAGICKDDSETAGFGKLLYAYLDSTFAIPEKGETIFDLSEGTNPDSLPCGDCHLVVVRLQLSQNVVLLEEIHFENSRLRLRVSGMDIYGAYALLEALMSTCERAAKHHQNPKLKEEDGRVYEIQDREMGGEFFRIRQIDAATAEIVMSGWY